MFKIFLEVCCFVTLKAAVSNSLLVEHQLSNGRAQVLEDSSGNQFHAVNGNSLFSEPEDVVWTNQGAFFSGDQHLLVASNAVTDAELLLSQSFTLTLWIYPTEDQGYLAGKSSTLGLCMDQPDLCVAFENTYYYMFLDVTLEYTTKTFFVRWNTEDSFIRTVPSTWTDTGTVPFQIGNNIYGFSGFMHKMTMYQGIVASDELEGSAIITTNPSCNAHPADEETCLSECNLDETSQDCTACYCVMESCGVSATCSECDPSCDEYCLDDSGCVDLTLAFCDPSPYTTATKSCEFSVECPVDCYYCEISAECLECDSGYFLLPSLQCSSECPDQYYADFATNQCEACQSDCATCTGSLSTDCITCAAEHASVVNSECACDSGYFTAETDPLTCTVCHAECLTCTGPLSTDCTVCSGDYTVLTEDGCVCEEHYYLSDTSTCEPCAEDCLSCSATECWECIGNLVVIDGVCACEPPLEHYADFCYETFSLSMHFDTDTMLVVTTDESTQALVNASVHLSVPTGHSVQWSLVDLNATVFEWEVQVTPASSSVLVTAEFDQGLFSDQGRLLSPLLYTVNYEPEETEEESGTSEDEFDDESELESSGYLGMYSLLTALVMGLVSMATLDDPSVLWTVTQTAQVISYMPLVKVSISHRLFHFLLSFQTVFFLPNLLVSLLPEESAAAPVTFAEYGEVKGEFSDVEFLRNGGRFFVVCVGVTVLQLFLVATTYCCAGKVSGRTKLKKMCSVMLRLWLELQLDLSVYAMVETPHLFANIPSSVLVVLMMILNATMPVVMLLIVFRSFSAIQQQEGDVNLYAGTLFKGLNHANKLQLSFYPALSLRKLAYCLSLYWLYEYPRVLLCLHLGLSFGIAVAESIVQVFESRANRIIQMAGEFTLCVTLGLLLAIYEEVGISKDLLEYAVMGLNILFIFTASMLQFVKMIARVFRCLFRRQKTRYVLPHDCASVDALAINSAVDNPDSPPLHRRNSFFDQLVFERIFHKPH